MGGDLSSKEGWRIAAMIAGSAYGDGGEGICLTYYSFKDIQKLEKFMQGKPIAEQEIGKQLLMETVAYAETSLCRRKVLLHYFGETYEEDNCGCCDNCLYPKKEFEGEDYMVDALQLVSDVKEKFKIEHLVNILICDKTGRSNVKCDGYCCCTQCSIAFCIVTK